MYIFELHLNIIILFILAHPRVIFHNSEILIFLYRNLRKYTENQEFKKFLQKSKLNTDN